MAPLALPAATLGAWRSLYIYMNMTIYEVVITHGEVLYGHISTCSQADDDGNNNPEQAIFL